MQINGKLGFKEITEFGMALGLGLIAGLAIWFILWVFSLITWIFSWFIISIIVTPVIFWILRYARGEIYIEDLDDPDENYIC